jgi:hypothetical protein
MITACDEIAKEDYIRTEVQYDVDHRKARANKMTAANIEIAYRERA